MTKIGSRSNVLKRHEFYLFVIILFLSVVITVFNRSFTTLENILDLLKIYSFIGILATGVFVVLLSGGIDLSFTAVATVSMYLMGSYMLSFEGNLSMAILIALSVGAMLGAINALLVHFLRIQTIIITLGTLNVYWGSLMFLSGGRDIYNLPTWFRNFAKFNLVQWTSENGSVYGLSIFILMWIAVLLMTWAILKYTMIGRGVYSLGGGLQAACRAGFNIIKINFFTYCYAGLIASIASIVHVGLVDQIAPHSIVGKELVVIAAVILGGASLVGGSGTLLGTVLGVILIAVIGNGLTLMRVSSYWQGIFTGFILLVGIYIISYRRRVREKEIVRVNVE
jgi:simple sugar transport system permease protein